MGNISLSGATSATTGVSLTSNGTSNNYTGIIINTYGNVTVTGNASNASWTNFSISRGSQGGTGTTTWNLYGDISMSNATTQNSNTGGAKFVSAKSGTQNLTFTSVTFGGGGFPDSVSSVTTLNVGNSVIGGNGNFTLNSGATLITAHKGGIDSSIATTGTKTLSTAANYAFNGSSAQVTGILLPTTVKNLIINNSSGVSLSNHVVVSDTVTLTSGNLLLDTNYVIAGFVSGGSMSSYVSTDSAVGYLRIPNVGSTQVLFPTGTAVEGYSPVWITNSASADTFKVAAAVDSSAAVGGGRVKVKWNISEAAAGASNCALQFGWIPGAENASFSANRSASSKIFYLTGTTDIEAGSGSYTKQLSTQPYTVARGGITSLGTFGIGSFALSSALYRSNAPSGGNWSNASSWQVWSGSSWVAASTAPTGTETKITIQSTDSIAVDIPVTLVDTLDNQGKINGKSNLTFGANALYQHDQDGGSIPTATWDSASTCLVTGTVATAPSNANQNFYNVVWNCPSQTANLNLGWNGITIGGNITVTNTGTGRWQLCAPAVGSSATVTINGNVNVSGGQFTTNGTSNANTTIVIDHYGNINVTAGNFSISRGSQGGTGTAVWNLHSGNFSMSNATTANSNASGAKFVFSKQGTQTITLGSGNTLTALPIEVSSGTTLHLDTNVIAGSGVFIADSGATIETKLATGINGTLTNTGGITLSRKANFTYDGTLPQVTGTVLPDTVNSLTIADSNGVVLTNPTLINGVLTLTAGLFNNIIPFTLGPSGSIAYAGGRLLLPYSLKVVTIAVARQDTNHDYIPDYLGDTLKVFGIVTSPNLGSTYTSYFIEDSTAGIDVYTGSAVMNFKMGDSVFVIGAIKQNRGLTEISPLAADSIHFWYLKHNATVPKPKLLTLHQYVMNPEGYEGLLIQVDTLYKASGTWGSGATIDLMNSSKADTAYLYINANTDVGGAAEPQYPINVVGIASQYTTSSSVYNNGYEIIPRDTSDIIPIKLVGVENNLNDIPKDFYISQNYPNPFNPSTTINFGLPKASEVQIEVYNILGQRLAVLADGKMEAGNHTVVFNGDRFASGVYFYVMRAGDRTFKEKMLLIK
jgi:hypothetical protein